MLDHVEHEYQIELMRNQIGHRSDDVRIASKTGFRNRTRVVRDLDSEAFPPTVCGYGQMCAVPASDVKHGQSLTSAEFIED